MVLTVISASKKSEDQLAIEFVDVYSKKPVNGNYKHLRTLYPSTDDSTSWDIVRNRKLEKLKKTVSKDTELFDSNGAPTSVHVSLIQWAWSPEAAKLKTWASAHGKKRKSDSTSRSEEDESEDDSDLSSDGDDVPKRRKVE